MTALVLIHGYPFDSSLWTPQIEAFAASHQVVALDLPGFGAAPPAPWTIDSVADEIAEGLRELGVAEPFALGGLSMGGYIALAFARKYPERLNALILADTRAGADDAKAKEGRAAMIALAKEKGSPAIAAAMLPKAFGATTHAERPEVVAFVTAMCERQPVEGIVNALEALRDRPDATPGLASLTVPTLVIVGDEDIITPPAMSEALAKSINGAKLVVIPKAGHVSNLEAAQEFNAAVKQFLDDFRSRL